MSAKPNKQSVYNFTVSNMQQAVNLINQFLSTNQFQLQTARNGQQYFHYNDIAKSMLVMYSEKGFEYYINGNNLQIVAYLGSYESPKPLDNSFVMALPKSEYKSMLQHLFDAIVAIDNPNMQQQAPQAPGQSTYRPQG